MATHLMESVKSVGGKQLIENRLRLKSKITKKKKQRTMNLFQDWYTNKWQQTGELHVQEQIWKKKKKKSASE